MGAVWQAVASSNDPLRWWVNACRNGAPRFVARMAVAVVSARSS